MIADPLALVGVALLGTLFSSILSCIPALHIYNVAGLLILLTAGFQERVPGDLLAMFLLGMVVGYAFLNAIPSIFAGAPDDSTAFIVLPGQRYLMARRGFEAAVLIGVGGLGALVVLSLFLPLAPRILPQVRAITQPHLHWILGAVILFMLMSEWPRGWERGASGLARFVDAWRSLAIGLLTFFLSGLLGLILFYGALVPVGRAFQSLTPAFVGLFALPWVLHNLISRVRVPPRCLAVSIALTPGLVLRGVGSGVLGGLFAAFFPAVTGGVGSLLAGHATAQWDDRLFLIGQGASKLVYYVGGLLLFFVPGLHLTRGGLAWMLSVQYAAYSPSTYWLALSATLLCGALAFVLLLWLSRGAVWLLSRVDYRWISGGTLVVLVGVVLALTGWTGLLIALVGMGIGLLPVLWGARRMNCLGVVLLPLTLNLAGLGAPAAKWLGLI